MHGCVRGLGCNILIYSTNTARNEPSPEDKRTKEGGLTNAERTEH